MNTLAVELHPQAQSIKCTEASLIERIKAKDQGVSQLDSEITAEFIKCLPY